MARQTKRMSYDAARDVSSVLFNALRGRKPENPAAARQAFADLLTMAGIGAFGAAVAAAARNTTQNDDTDAPDERLLGASVDEANGALLKSLRTGNRINVSQGARSLIDLVQKHALDRFGVDLGNPHINIKDDSGQEQDLWLRYRNYPWIREAILMGLAETGQWEEFNRQADATAGEYLSLGLITSLPPFASLNQFNKNKTTPFLLTDAAYDLLTSPIIPSRLRKQTLVPLADPISRQVEPRKSQDKPGVASLSHEPGAWDTYQPGAKEAIMAGTPFLSKLLPAAGATVTGEPRQFDPGRWYQNQVRTLSQHLQEGDINRKQYQKALGEARSAFEDLKANGMNKESTAKLYKDFGIEPTPAQIAQTTSTPLPQMLLNLRKLGVGPESVRSVTSRDKQGQPITKVSIPKPESINVTNRGLMGLRQLTGMNILPATRGAVKEAVEKNSNFVKAPWKNPNVK